MFHKLAYTKRLTIYIRFMKYIKLLNPLPVMYVLFFYSFQAPGLAHQSASHRVFHKHDCENISLLKDKASGHSV